jgi:hypothetical protein
MFRLPYAFGLVLVGAGLISGCAEKQEQVSFKEAVLPVLNRHCLECHKAGGDGEQKSGLSMESYESLMKGTRFGAVVLPGDSLGSTLNMLVEGRADASIRMPHHGDALPSADAALLKAWVDQGAKNN